MDKFAGERSSDARRNPKTSLLRLSQIMPFARAQRLRAIFDEAVERPGAERAGFVHAACQGDESLEREVFSLLQSLESKGQALEVDAAAWFGRAAGNAIGDPAPVAPGEAPTGTRDPDLHGVVIGDFRLVRMIGRGGIGAVYEAEQLSVHRRVAVKLLQAWTASRDLRRRFLEESVILAKLKHQGIAQVFAAGTRTLELSGPDQVLAAGIFNDLHSVPWMAMELIEEAQSVLEWSRGRWPAEVLRLFANICDALHYGHQQGIIHRDLKPANILVNVRGEPKLIDFGIARVLVPRTTHPAGSTVTGTLLGSPRYMSPEQGEGGEAGVDTRSDIYSLGVVLFESMLGVMPYELDEQSLVASVRTIRDIPARDPRSLSPGISKDMAAVMLKALNKRPQERYQSAGDFGSDLRHLLQREPVTARRVSWAHRSALLVRRRPVVPVLVGFAALGMIAGVVGISVGLARERVARHAADRAAWLANLTAADSSLRLGDGGSARRRLEAVPESLRKWEWYLLRELSDTSVDQWRVTTQMAGTFLARSGRTLVCHVAGEDPDDLQAFHADVYDVVTRRMLYRLEHMHNAGRTSWSMDERLIACCRDHDILIVDSTSGRTIRSLPIPADGFALGVGFSPDGRQLIAGLTAPMGVMVFNLDSGEIVFQRASDVWVFDAAFSPNGSRIAWCGAAGVELVDTPSWTTSSVVPIPRPAQNEHGMLAFSPDGSMLAVALGRDVRLIDLQTERVRFVLRGHAQRVRSLTFDTSGERLVTASVDRTVRVWNTADGSAVATLLGHETPTLSATFLPGAGPGSPSIASVDEENRLRFWNLNSGGPVYATLAQDCTEYIKSLRFTGDGSLLSFSGKGALGLISTALSPHRLEQQDLRTMGGAMIPELGLAVTERDDGTIAARQSDSQQQRWCVPCGAAVMGLEASETGKILAVLLDEHVLLIDAADGRVLSRIDMPNDHAMAVVFAKADTQLVTTTASGTVCLWDTATGSQIERIASPGPRGSGLACSSDGRFVAFCHSDDGVTLWDRRDRREITRIDHVGGNIFSIAINPDNTRLAVGAQDRICHVYDVPSGDEVLQLRDHVGTVMCVAWSPDGRILATGGYDKTVRLYSAARP